jgi:hypothetical protein
MIDKKLKIVFEEGCFDEMDDMTQEEMDDLIAELQEQLESGELFENATPVSELPEEEQQEIIEMLNRKNKNTRQ